MCSILAVIHVTSICLKGMQGMVFRLPNDMQEMDGWMERGVALFLSFCAACSDAEWMAKGKKMAERSDSMAQFFAVVVIILLSRLTFKSGADVLLSFGRKISLTVVFQA